MPAKPPSRTKVGQLRPSQLLFTFGVGAVVELPHLSAITQGLDEWDTLHSEGLSEPRLLNLVQSWVGPHVLALKSPPLTDDPDSKSGRNIGVPFRLFPRWQRCPGCAMLNTVDCGVFQFKLNPYRPDRQRIVHSKCGKAKGGDVTVMPARYIVACENGHLDDFPWRLFVHGHENCHGLLHLVEVGASGKVSELRLECRECNAKRNLADAFDEAGRSGLGPCTGSHPHLGIHQAGCKARVRPILLGSSNCWFPLRVSALSIPEGRDELEDLLDQNWELLYDCEDQRDVERSIRRTTLAAWPADQLWTRIERKKNRPVQAEAKDPQDLKRREWLTLTQAEQQEPDLTLREVTVPNELLERVVLVERLREVHALIGFTRLESPEEYEDWNQIPAARRAPLARKPLDWIPAVENRGEGIFLQLREDRLQEWTARPAVVRRGQQLFRSHQAWRQLRRLPFPEKNFPGIRYVLLHSLAHALIRELSLECGYSASSLRERIYVADSDGDEPPMAGILLYTAAPDSEGTLGGLVQMGTPERLAEVLARSLTSLELCTSDPLCSHHVPDQTGLDLHGASCHACLFASETSCERGNRYLDRSLLVWTVESDQLAYFQCPGSPPEPVQAPQLPGTQSTAEQGMPFYRLPDLKTPTTWRRWPALDPDESLFALQMPDQRLNKEIPQGGWVVMQRVKPKDELPEDGAICLVESPTALELGRLFTSVRVDQNNQPLPTVVTIRHRSTERRNPSRWEVAVDEWSNWRPVARFHSLAPEVEDAR